MNNNIEEQISYIRKIYESAYTVLSTMKDKERMQVKHLAEIVSLSMAVHPKDILPFIKLYLQQTDVAYVVHGKNGGVVKGKK